MTIVSLNDKESLRSVCLERRGQIGASYAREAADSLAVHLLSLIPQAAKTVAGYLPIRGEIDIGPALTALAATHIISLPVIVRKDSPLAFRRWQIGGALEKGMYGIEIPLSTEPPVIPDAVIVPLLGFDQSGHRLGYGAGFYDMTIRKLREMHTHVAIIGAAYAIQEVPHIPPEAYDERLDAVATEKGTVILGEA